MIAVCIRMLSLGTLLRLGSHPHQFVLDTGLDLIPHVPKRVQAFLEVTCGLRRISKGPVQALARSCEERARFVCVVADGDDVIERFSEVTLQRLDSWAEISTPISAMTEIASCLTCVASVPALNTS